MGGLAIYRWRCLACARTASKSFRPFLISRELVHQDTEDVLGSVRVTVDRLAASALQRKTVENLVHFHVANYSVVAFSLGPLVTKVFLGITVVMRSTRSMFVYRDELTLTS